MKCSVIVPVFNEAANLPLLYARLAAALGPNPDWELVLVNDGSTDESLPVIRTLAAADHRVRYIDLSRNFGHQAAVSCGVDHAAGEVLVLMDADLQDPPELIPALLGKVAEGYDVVAARRRRRQGESWLKRWTARVFYRLLAWASPVPIPTDTGDFRAFSHTVAAVLRNMPERHKFLRGQIAWLGFRQTFVWYDRAERHAGRTAYSYAKMVRLALDALTAFSDVPIRFVSLSGFAVSGLSFAMILYAYYKKVFTQDYVPGWASLMVSVLFIGGVQLISIGIIGEYISRIHQNVLARPLYVVRETNLPIPPP